MVYNIHGLHERVYTAAYEGITTFGPLTWTSKYSIAIKHNFPWFQQLVDKNQFVPAQLHLPEKITNSNTPIWYLIKLYKPFPYPPSKSTALFIFKSKYRLERNQISIVPWHLYRRCCIVPHVINRWDKDYHYKSLSSITNSSQGLSHRLPSTQRSLLFQGASIFISVSRSTGLFELNWKHHPHHTSLGFIQNPITGLHW